MGIADLNPSVYHARQEREVSPYVDHHELMAKGSKVAMEPFAEDESIESIPCHL